jgi:hypothetical protein
MSLKLGKPNVPPSEPRKNKQRETREAIVQDADKTEGKDRDLVHGDGGTLGFGNGEVGRPTHVVSARSDHDSVRKSY